MINYKEFFAELYEQTICKECGYPIEECECGDTADQRLYPEEYPYGGYKITDRDVEADQKSEYKIHHKPRDMMGQEDADVNNDGKVDIIDKYLKAKRDLYKRFLLAKKKGQKTL